MMPESSGPPSSSSVWQRLPNSRRLPAIILPLILAAHLFLLLRLHPTQLFGLQQDDALYFSSAKALAESRGYILPSLPGAPAATKYPILYPWLLSWVWRANPNFPANLWLAFTLNYFFALAAILLSYFFCRFPLRLARNASLAVTAFCALHPAFLFYSARLMTDVPFAALALAFLLIAWKSGQDDSPLQWAILAGVFADLCVLMRLAGAAFIAGLLLALLLRKHWKTAAVFLASCIPGISYFLYRGWFHAPSAPPAPFSAALPGWQQTWYYFTSYTSFRHLDSPNLSATATLLLNQILYLFSSIAGYFVTPLSDSSIVIWLVSCLAFVTLLLLGALRRAGRRHISPELAILAFYLVLLIGWDYVEWTRFLFPFYPLIVVLIASEGWRWFALLRGSGTDWLSRSLLALFLLFSFALAAATGWNYLVSARRPFSGITRHRAAVLLEQQAAYAWIRSHTRPEDILITTDYASTYVYTGRQSINFTVPRPYGVYDRSVLQRDLEHMQDVALALHARYWVISDYDSQTQLRAFELPLGERLSRFEAALPRAYTTPAGSIRIYELHPLRTLAPAPASSTIPTRTVPN
jgi:4-amino-4-deoxy-L-arabinose transferase-like glycosyltransferase